MSKHTPGPWTIGGPNRVGEEALGIIEGKDKYVVADVWADVEELDARANANLIAAAPEMYEALKKCQLQLLQSGIDHEYVSEALGEAQIALAKAEGRQ